MACKKVIETLVKVTVKVQLPLHPAGTSVSSS